MIGRQRRDTWAAHYGTPPARDCKSAAALAKGPGTSVAQYRNMNAGLRAYPHVYATGSK